MNDTDRNLLTRAVLRGVEEFSTNPNGFAISMAGVQRKIDAGETDPLAVIDQAFHGGLRVKVRKHFRALSR